jgi:hypothetical protein
MTALRVHRHDPRLSGVAGFVRDFFWVMALGIIGCFVFFFALGAITPGDVWGVTFSVGALCLLWLARAWAVEHHRREERDPRLAHERERRGF